MASGSLEVRRFYLLSNWTEVDIDIQRLMIKVSLIANYLLLMDVRLNFLSAV